MAPATPAAAYLARMRSSGYVSAVAVAPAALPARNRTAILLPPPPSFASPTSSPNARSATRRAAASYLGYARNDTPAYGTTRAIITPFPRHNPAAPSAATISRAVRIAFVSVNARLASTW